MKKLTTLLFIILTIVILFRKIQITSAQVLEQDSLALLELYDSTNGPGWTNRTNWLTTNSLDSWYGITVSDNRVTRIELASNNLVGKIPVSIGNIDSLQYLILNSNQLSDTIPASIGNLISLDSMFLYSNQLSGTIPKSFGNLTELELLSMHYNQLSGSIPTELGNLNKLVYLILSNNQLTDTIPSELGNLTNLEGLYLYSNELTGKIPTTLGNLSNLTNLQLYDNNLTDTIPKELGNLTNLQHLYLSNNELSGKIPPELGNLTSLQYLWLGVNQLSDTIPSELGNLPVLSQLRLQNNSLTGKIPPELGNLSNLQTLYLSLNQLTGNIPPELGNLTSNTNYIYLSDNQLSDTIPKELGNIPNLWDLFLSNNQLSGNVPSEFTNLTSLKQLYVNNNELTGFPDLSSLTNITWLKIEDNKFTFEDVEPNIGVASSGFTYTPQDSIGYQLDTTVNLGAALAFSVSAKGTSTNYQWKKDNINIDGATDSAYFITSADFSDSGTYTCVATNTITTGLALYSRPITLNVEATPLQLDSLVLVELYESTFGGIWYNNTNWLTAQPLSTWYGITVSGGRVTGIDLSNNSLLDSVPSSLNNLSDLQTLYLNDNGLYYIPDLSSLTNLTDLKIENNHLTFESIEPNLGVPSSVFTYSPQDSLGTKTLTSVYYKSSLTLTVTAGGANNVYQWEKDGIEIPGANMDSYTINSVEFTDSGSYTCYITNTLVIDLTLYKRPIIVSVEYSPLQQDSLILIDFYDSTDGINWTIDTNWLTTKPLSSWHGIDVSGDRVSTINLSSNNLIGPIIPELGNLIGLESIYFNYNQLYGHLPVELGNLSNLVNLYIEDNQISDTIPSELGNLVNLERLYLNENLLSDSVPPELGNLSNLTYLRLNNNQLTYYPPELGNLSSLEYLELSSNQFTRFLPELGNLSSLEQLFLFSNPIVDTIPSEIGNLTNLITLYISNNQLYGKIPTELGDLSSLISLRLNDNELTDSVPSVLSGITSLKYLYVYNNNLSDFPDFSTSNLSQLQIQNNKFTFEDIEPNVGFLPGGWFTYAPQDSIGNKIDTTVNIGAVLNFKDSVGGSNNVYQWVKDGADIIGATDMLFTLNVEDYSDSGTYICKITNTIATELTIYSKPKNVKIFNTPPIWSIPDTLTFAEDDSLIIDLDTLFTDNYSPDSTIIISCINGSFVNVSVNTITHIAVFINSLNQYGTDTLVFTCTDQGGLSANDSVIIIVTPTNDPPVVTSSENVNATEDTLFSYTATTDDIDGDIPVISFEDIPSWLDTSGVVISGTPLEEDGDTSFVIIATDGELSDTLIVNIIVIEVNDSVVITSASSASATEDVYFTYTATADDPDDVPSFYFIDYPAWLSAAGAEISGIPLEGDGNTSFTVIATDGFLPDTLVVTLIVTPVNDPPVITSLNYANATEDILFSYTATADDPDDVPQIYFNDIPSWLDTSGAVISGTPGAFDGDTSFMVIAADSELSDTLTVNLSVTMVNVTPELINPMPDTITILEDAIAVLLADLNHVFNDPDGDSLFFSADIQNSPNITIDIINDSLYATPDTNYYTPYTSIVVDIYATDSVFWVFQRINIWIQGVNDPPYLDSLIPDLILYEDNNNTYFGDFIGLFTYFSDIEDHTLDYAVNCTDSGINVRTDGLYVEVMTVPDSFGVFTVDVIATDDSGAFVTDTFDIIVQSVNDRPIIEYNFPNFIYFPEDTGTVLIADLDTVFSDIDNDELEYILTTSSDTGLTASLINDSLLITTMQDLDDYIQIIISANDGVDTVEQDFYVVINAVNDAPKFIATMPDTTFNEDSEYEVLLSLIYEYVEDVDNEWYDFNLFVNANTINTYINSERIRLTPPEENWFGVDTIYVIVTDGELYDTTSFIATVVPVNDAPEQVDPIYPWGITVESFEITFEWHSTTDVEGDAVLYNLIISGNDFDTTITGLTDTTFNFDGNDILQYETTYMWCVEASDGMAVSGCMELQFYTPVDTSGVGIDLTYQLSDFSLRQNYPNPFNLNTIIEYNLPALSDVQLIIYDILGQEVATLINKQMMAGFYQTKWNGISNEGNIVSAGIYIYKIYITELNSSKQYIDEKIMIILK